MTQLFQSIEDLRDLTTASDRSADEGLAATVAELLQQVVVWLAAVPEPFIRRSDTHGGRGRWILHRAPFTISSIVWARARSPRRTHTRPEVRSASSLT